MSGFLFTLFLALPLALAARAVNADDLGQQCTYSFFFFTFRQPFAAKAVYDRVYPTAPMVSEYH